MSDGKADFEIRFKTSHENTGGEQANNQLTKATGTAQRLKAAVKGVALEFPVLARVIGFVTSPITLFAAAASVAANAVLNWKRNIEELGKKQAELETLRFTMASYATILKDIEQANVAKAISAIGEAARGAVTELNKLNGKIDEALERNKELGALETEREKSAVKADVAKGLISEAEGRKKLAFLDQIAEESDAQAEFRALQKKKKNFEDALRETEPQLARLQHTPDEDLARMKKRAADAEGSKTAAENALKEQGPKLLDERDDAAAALTAFRQGNGVAVTDWMKFGIAGGGKSKAEIDQAISDFVEQKQREFDALVKTKDFEAAKAKKLGGEVSSAEAQNAQIESIEGTQDELRTGIKSTDEEIKTRVMHNRQMLKQKRFIRGNQLDEADAIDQRREEEKRHKEEERRIKSGGRNRDDGASIGGGTGAGLAGVRTIADGNRDIAAQLSGAFAEIRNAQQEILQVVQSHRREMANVKAYAKDLREV